MKTGDLSPKTLLVGAAAIAVLVLVSYAPATGNGYIWDDDDYVHKNPLLGQPDGLFDIWLGFDLKSTDPLIVTCETPQYYPLVFTTFYIEHFFWGMDPSGYHMTNIIFHALNAILVFFLFRRLGLHPAAAWFAAALFGAHPVEVESVAWVSERKNVLSAFFYLLAFLAWLRFSDSGRKRLYFLSLFLFVCALLSKSVTATLPVVIGLAEYLRRRPINVRLVGLLVPFLVIGLVSGMFTAHIEKYHVGAGGTDWSFTIVERCLIASRALCFYAQKLIWPIDLTFIYPRWEIDSAAAWQYLFPFLVAVTGLALFLLSFRRTRVPFFGVAFFSVSLLPALGFVDFYPQVYSFVADHFQYIGSLGVLFIVAWAVVRLAGLTVRAGNRRPDGRNCSPGALRRVAVPAAAVIVLCALTFQTRAQCRIYKDQEALWTDTIAKNEKDFLGHNNLGVLLLGKKRANEAEAHFRAAVTNNPGYHLSYLNLAGISLRKGEVTGAKGRPVLAEDLFAKAVEFARECVRLKPDFAKGRNILGETLRQRGMFAEAGAEFREAIRLAPLYEIPSGNLAKMALLQGEYDKAAGHYGRVIRLKPRSIAARIKMAEALVLSGRPAAAAETLREADEIRPDAMNSDEKARNGAEAVRLAERVCKLTGGRKAQLLAILAAAYAEAGDFERAVKIQGRLAMSAPPGQKEEQQRIHELYKAGIPYRE